jgi:hypothetical protein
MDDNKSIIILDEVLDSEGFKALKDYCFEEHRFSALEKGDHIYYVANAPRDAIDKINTAIEEAYKVKIQNSISFLRLASSLCDTDLRIHCDNGNVGTDFVPTHGAVFYITHDENNINGTAFWKHCKYGYVCPPDFTDEDIQKNIMCDKENPLKWNLSTIVGGVPNRLLSYPSKYFHSKYPRVMNGTKVKDSRIVMVIFFKV